VSFHIQKAKDNEKEQAMVAALDVLEPISQGG